MGLKLFAEPVRTARRRHECEASVSGNWLTGVKFSGQESVGERIIRKETQPELVALSQYAVVFGFAPQERILVLDRDERGSVAGRSLGFAQLGHRKI